MALVPGTRLGPFTIESLLGAGGMGEAYRATDVHLSRPDRLTPDSWTADGKSLVYTVGSAEGGGADIWLLPRVVTGNPYLWLRSDSARRVVRCHLTGGGWPTSRTRRKPVKSS